MLSATVSALNIMCAAHGFDSVEKVKGHANSVGRQSAYSVGRSPVHVGIQRELNKHSSKLGSVVYWIPGRSILIAARIREPFV